jgi:hypothetical protein
MVRLSAVRNTSPATTTRPPRFAPPLLLLLCSSDLVPGHARTADKISVTCSSTSIQLIGTHNSYHIAPHKSRRSTSFSSPVNPRSCRPLNTRTAHCPNNCSSCRCDNWNWICLLIRMVACSPNRWPVIY